MNPEYDFSKGERGKFFRSDAVLNIPVYLDPDVEEFIHSLAERTDQNVDRLVNDWLRSSIGIVQSVQPPLDPEAAGSRS